MAVGDLARADPLPVVLSWLGGHPVLTDALGGSGRVDGRNEPPYPRVRLLDPTGGSDLGLRWLVAPRIQVEALGDLDGSPGKAELRRICYLTLGALTELPERTAAAGDPVVTAVESAAGGGWSPLPNGQPRYLTAVRVYLHPPQT